MAEHTRVADNFQYDERLTPYENLAAAIIRRAIMDARRIDLGKQSQRDSHYYKSEILIFFKSKWCGVLLSTTTLTGDDIRKAVGW